MNWISVDDRLPDHDQVVLAVLKKPTGSGTEWYTYPLNLELLNFYSANQYNRFFREKSSLHPIDSTLVTHWMPIPTEP